MRIAVSYICVSRGKLTLRFASRFMATYRQCPAGVEHDVIAVCNGGPPPTDVGLALLPLNPAVLPRSNDGWDIGGHIEAARGPAKDHDLIVCLGESVYFHRPGWLKRIADSFSECGDGMYGIFSSHVLRPHLGTTAFATSPKLLAAYPRPVHNKEERYEFEHGKQSFWRWLALCGKPSRLVTFDGCWPPGQWRVPRNILWRGDQSNCLVWCNHTDNFQRMPIKAKSFWQFHADRKAA